MRSWFCIWILCCLPVLRAYACHSLLPVSSVAPVCIGWYGWCDSIASLPLQLAFLFSTECPSFIVQYIGNSHCSDTATLHLHTHTHSISFTMQYQWHNIAYNCCNRFSYARIWLASKALIVGVAFHKATRTWRQSSHFASPHLASRTSRAAHTFFRIHSISLTQTHTEWARDKPRFYGVIS